MTLSMESENKKSGEDHKYLNILEEKVNQMTATMEALKEEENPSYEELKVEAIGNFKQLLENHQFKSFCVKNYLRLISDFLNISSDDLDMILERCNYIIEEENKEDLINESQYVNFDSDQLLEEIKHKEAALEQLEYKYSQFKHKVMEFLNPSTLVGLDQACHLFQTKSSKIKEDQTLILDFTEENDIELTQELQSYILPNLVNFQVKRIAKDLTIFKDFILSSFPKYVTSCHLNYNGGLINSGNILEIILSISQNVSESLCLYCFNINQIELKRIFQITRQKKKTLAFFRCNIDLDSVPDLENALHGSIIRDLHFENCANSKYGDWKNHPERFKHLTIGLSKSKDFVNSFETIYLNNCGLSSETIIQTLDENGFTNVEPYDRSQKKEGSLRNQ